jgi:FkbM family methyltransferase
MLTTKQKVFLASRAQEGIVFLRSVFGKGYDAEAYRSGLRWQLDLREGIDFSIYLVGAFELGTAKTLAGLIKQGDVVFDIGANIGAHTLGMAKSVGPNGKVFAIEPADFAFAKLLRNLALNSELEGRVHASQFFLGSGAVASPPTEIYASWPLGNDADVHPKHRGRLVSANHAVMDTLDSFVNRRQISRLDLIKIDVDGQELPVFHGGLATLRRFRPILVMEIAPYVHAEHNNSFAEFVDLLKGCGYSLSDADNGQSIPLDAAELERMVPDGGSINVVGRATSVG